MLKDAAPLLALFIPIIAIIGGIVAGIVKIIAKNRIAELAYRERITAIERGIDPGQLPPLPMVDPDLQSSVTAAVQTVGSPEYQRHRAHGLIIGGLVTTFTGIALIVFFAMISDDPNVWVIGLIPTAVGLALLLSARVIWPRSNGEKRPTAGGALGA